MDFLRFNGVGKNVGKVKKGLLHVPTNVGVVGDNVGVVPTY